MTDICWCLSPVSVIPITPTTSHPTYHPLTGLISPSHRDNIVLSPPFNGHIAGLKLLSGGCECVSGGQWWGAGAWGGVMMGQAGG